MEKLMLVSVYLKVVKNEMIICGFNPDDLHNPLNLN